MQKGGSPAGVFCFCFSSHSTSRIPYFEEPKTHPIQQEDSSNLSIASTATITMFEIFHHFPLTSSKETEPPNHQLSSSTTNALHPQRNTESRYRPAFLHRHRNQSRGRVRRARQHQVPWRCCHHGLINTKNIHAEKSIRGYGSARAFQNGGHEGSCTAVLR